MRNATLSFARMVICAGAATIATTARSDDFGLGSLATQVNISIRTPAVVPFLELPSVLDAGFAAPQGFGILGSVSNPALGYPLGRSGSVYYKTDSDYKCNPSSWAQPSGQKGPQAVRYSNDFLFEVKAGEITLKGRQKNDTVFSLTAFQAEVIRKVKINFTEIKEYTLDFPELRSRVQQASSRNGCEQFAMALTKLVEGKVTITYYFKAGASANANLAAGVINAKLGLEAAYKAGESPTEPNTIQFQSEARVFAAKFRPVSEILGRRAVPKPSPRVAASG